MIRNITEKLRPVVTEIAEIDPRIPDSAAHNALDATQRAVLRCLISQSTTWWHRPSEAPDRPYYPACGWVWDNHSITVRVLDSLVKRGLVARADRSMNDGHRRPGPHDPVYYITAAGREAII